MALNTLESLPEVSEYSLPPSVNGDITGECLLRIPSIRWSIIRDYAPQNIVCVVTWWGQEKGAKTLIQPNVVGGGKRQNPGNIRFGNENKSNNNSQNVERRFPSDVLFPLKSDKACIRQYLEDMGNLPITIVDPNDNYNVIGFCTIPTSKENKRKRKSLSKNRYRDHTFHIRDEEGKIIGDLLVFLQMKFGTKSILHSTLSKQAQDIIKETSKRQQENKINNERIAEEKRNQNMNRGNVIYEEMDETDGDIKVEDLSIDEKQNNNNNNKRHITNVYVPNAPPLSPTRNERDDDDDVTFHSDFINLAQMIDDDFTDHLFPIDEEKNNHPKKTEKLSTFQLNEAVAKVDYSNNLPTKPNSNKKNDRNNTVKRISQKNDETSFIMDSENIQRRKKLVEDKMKRNDYNFDQNRNETHYPSNNTNNNNNKSNSSSGGFFPNEHQPKSSYSNQTDYKNNNNNNNETVLSKLNAIVERGKELSQMMNETLAKSDEKKYRNVGNDNNQQNMMNSFNLQDLQDELGLEIEEDLYFYDDENDNENNNINRNDPDHLLYQLNKEKADYTKQKNDKINVFQSDDKYISNLLKQLKSIEDNPFLDDLENEIKTNDEINLNTNNSNETDKEDDNEEIKNDDDDDEEIQSKNGENEHENKNNEEMKNNDPIVENKMDEIKYSSPNLPLSIFLEINRLQDILVSSKVRPVGWKTNGYEPISAFQIDIRLPKSMQRRKIKSEASINFDSTTSLPTIKEKLTFILPFHEVLDPSRSPRVSFSESELLSLGMFDTLLISPPPLNRSKDSLHFQINTHIIVEISVIFQRKLGVGPHLIGITKLPLNSFKSFFSLITTSHGKIPSPPLSAVIEENITCPFTGQILGEVECMAWIGREGEIERLKHKKLEESDKTRSKLQHDLPHFAEIIYDDQNDDNITEVESIPEQEPEDEVDEIDDIIKKVNHKNEDDMVKDDNKNNNKKNKVKKIKVSKSKLQSWKPDIVQDESEDESDLFMLTKPVAFYSKVPVHWSTPRHQKKLRPSSSERKKKHQLSPHSTEKLGLFSPSYRKVKDEYKSPSYLNIKPETTIYKDLNAELPKVMPFDLKKNLLGTSLYQPEFKNDNIVNENEIEMKEDNIVQEEEEKGPKFDLSEWESKLKPREYDGNLSINDINNELNDLISTIKGEKPKKKESNIKPKIEKEIKIDEPNHKQINEPNEIKINEMNINPDRIPTPPPVIPLNYITSLLPRFVNSIDNNEPKLATYTEPSEDVNNIDLMGEDIIKVSDILKKKENDCEYPLTPDSNVEYPTLSEMATKIPLPFSPYSKKSPSYKYNYESKHFEMDRAHLPFETFPPPILNYNHNNNNNNNEINLVPESKIEVLSKVPIGIDITPPRLSDDVVDFSSFDIDTTLQTLPKPVIHSPVIVSISDPNEKVKKLSSPDHLMNDISLSQAPTPKNNLMSRSLDSYPFSQHKYGYQKPSYNFFDRNVDPNEVKLADFLPKTPPKKRKYNENNKKMIAPSLSPSPLSKFGKLPLPYLPDVPNLSTPKEIEDKPIPLSSSSMIPSGYTPARLKDPKSFWDDFDNSKNRRSSPKRNEMKRSSPKRSSRKKSSPKRNEIKKNKRPLVDYDFNFSEYEIERVSNIIRGALNSSDNFSYSSDDSI